MQAYINQLLADIKAAETRDRPTKPDYKILYPEHPAADPQYGGELDHIIEWEMGVGYGAEALFGIPKIAFPPSEKLDKTQIADLCEAILNLWSAYRILLTYPDDGDKAVLYAYLITEWGGGNFPLMPENGICGKETCDYNPDGCIWGEQCTCKDFEAWEMPEQTPEEKAYWEKGLQPGGGWINPEFLDENGNFDSSKLQDFHFSDEEDEGNNDEEDKLPV
jgi:hypothetical protein